MPETNSIARLKNMIHYIVDTVPRQALGKVKLNKILWFSDREMYLRYNTTISGDSYLRFPQGPVSKNILIALEELSNEEKILIRKIRETYDRVYDRYEYISLKDPDISDFRADEIDVIGRQITWIEPLTAREVSEISHDRTWDIFNDGETIPMYAVLASETRSLQPSDLDWAMRG